MVNVDWAIQNYSTKKGPNFTVMTPFSLHSLVTLACKGVFVNFYDDCRKYIT